MSETATTSAVVPDPTVPVGLTWHIVRKNLTVISASYVVGAVAGFVTQSVLARTLGSRTYGIYAAGFALVTIVGVAQEVAGPAWLVRTAAQRDTSFRDLFGSVFGFRIIAGVAVIGIAAAGAALMGFDVHEVLVVVLLAAIAGLNAALRTLRAGFQAAERMGANAALAGANAVITAAVVVTLVAAGAGLVTALVGSLVVSVLLLPPAWKLLPRSRRPRLNMQLSSMWTAAQDSLPFTIVAGLSFALSYADTLVVRAILGTHATGLYGGAWRLVSVLQWIPAILLDSVLRGLSSLAAHDRRRFATALDRAAAGLLFIALPVAVAGTLLARPVFVFVFGSGFGAGAGAFRILLWSLPLSYPSWVLLEGMLVSGRPMRAAKLLGAAVVANVIANVVVVQRWGIEGSAWVMVATELVVLAGAVALMRDVSLRWPVALLPAAVVSVATLGAVLPLRHAPLVLPLLAGTAAFVTVTSLSWWWLSGSSAADRWLGRGTPP